MTRIRKPKDITNGFAQCILCKHEVPLEWTVRANLVPKQLKELHAWLSKAIKYLEGKR